MDENSVEIFNSMMEKEIIESYCEDINKHEDVINLREDLIKINKNLTIGTIDNKINMLLLDRNYITENGEKIPKLYKYIIPTNDGLEGILEYVKLLEKEHLKEEKDQ